MGQLGKPQLWWRDVAVEYLKNGNNATAAFGKVRTGLSKRTTEVEASKLLNKPEFQLILKDLLNDKRKLYTENQWFARIANVAEFDVSSLYEKGEDGNLRLRSNWKHIAARHGALKSVRTKTRRKILKKIGGAEVMQEDVDLEFDTYSAMEANEHLGRVLGYDTTDKKNKLAGIEDVNLFVMNLINSVSKLPEKKLAALTQEDDIEALLSAKVVGT